MEQLSMSRPSVLRTLSKAEISEYKKMAQKRYQMQQEHSQQLANLRKKPGAESPKSPTPTPMKGNPRYTLMEYKHESDDPESVAERARNQNEILKTQIALLEVIFRIQIRVLIITHREQYQRV
jgi:hypothetical protein